MKKIKAIVLAVILLSTFNVFAQLVEMPRETHPAVAYLIDHGINVEVYYSSGYPRPGEKTFREKLELFWPNTLDPVKEELIARKDLLNTITIVSYSSRGKSRLSLDVDHTSGSLLRYLKLVDKMNVVLGKINLKIDGGIDMHSVDEEQFEMYSNLIEFLENNIEKFKTISSFINEVEFDRGRSNVFLEFGYLKLSKDEYEQDFEKLFPQLENIALVFEGAKEFGVEIEIKFDFEKDKRELNTVLDAIRKAKTDLRQLFQSQAIKELNVWRSLETSSYLRSSQAFYVGAKAPGLSDLPAVLGALNYEQALSESIGLEFSSKDDLDKDYLNSIEKVKRLQSLIKSKSSHFEKIVLGHSLKSEKIYKTLYIGNEKSDSVLIDILNELD